MQIITEADFRREIKKNIVSGYLFFGEEDYLKAHAAATLRSLVCPDEAFAVFNCTKLSPPDYNPEALERALAPLPMMGERKFVELGGLDIQKMLVEDFDALCDVISTLSDYDYNTLVLLVSDGCIEEGNKKKPNERFAKLCSLLQPVKFDKCSPQKLAMWAARHFEHNGVAASPKICARVVEYCGCNMYKLAGEIDKVSFYARSKGREEVTESDILLVCTPDTEYDTFAFANALTSGARARALDILSLMKTRRIEPVVIMGEANKTFCDLMLIKAMSADGMGVAEISAETGIHSFRVGLYLNAVKDVDIGVLSHIIDLCSEADAVIKSSSRAYEAIEMFICSI